MAFIIDDGVLDAALAELAEATALVALSGMPADYAEADAGRLAAAALSGADFGIGAGVDGRRRVTIAAKADVNALAGGTADHVALLDEGSGRLLFAADCPAAAISNGGKVDFAAWEIELGGAAA
ncbi:hypothetical protein KCG44_00285 [Pacificimonas sp. WHA3]|uniref:Uncharacterized protein n=1 Tax=Pacificimonas pallii TaxID=2827236 RepID=A0ABS6SBG2_9SPHN|nr:hypothetical protein [Pacificimonas pallii]MBV7255212.1 hypothetical protein [Pacificimonas pallii]